jgi:osmoprotectant transport system ATP-binding protein
LIEFRHVGKRFADGTVGLEDLTLTAREGEITVLVGPSGCGKTTSLRTVNRMVEITSGSVHLDGRDVAEADPAELRRGIGYVIQQAGLFPHRRVIDNVATVPVLQGMPRAQARARAAEVLERVGLDAALAQRWPAQLSGGQQQRVGVARALAGDAPVLLMDEPFSAVDPVVRVELQDELLRLQADLGKTILFVTHDIDEAIRLGDRVAVLRVGGRLAQFAPPDEILAAPVDEFVSGFVGRDRGYRRLGFVPATALRLVDLPTSPDANGSSSGVPGEWTLLLDGAGRPAAWLGPDGGRHDLGSVYVTEGTDAAVEGAGTLRGALDAALSSPAGRGVAVDGEGRYRGGVDTDDVLALLDRGARSGDVGA